MGLVLAKPVLELLTEGHSKLTEPLVVLETLAHPDRGRMLRIVDGTIAVVGRVTCHRRGRAKVWDSLVQGRKDPVGCIEKLRGFQNHFDHVFVAMPARTTRRLMRQIEDVHFQSLLGGVKVGLGEAWPTILSQTIGLIELGNTRLLSL